MAKLPHIYRKLMEFAKDYDKMNHNYETKRTQFVSDIASSFRLNKDDISKALKELEKQKKVSRQRYRLKITA